MFELTFPPAASPGVGHRVPAEECGEQGAAQAGVQQQVQQGVHRRVQEPEVERHLGVHET